MKIGDKKTIYFHFGSNKTGSSALQAFFSENSTILKEKGIYYPPQPEYWNKEFKVSSGNAQHLFYGCDKCPPEEEGKNKVRNIFSLVEKYSKVLLSSEWLWLIDDKTSFLNNFKKENIEIVVIVYLRRQDEYLESAINQRVKVSKYTTVTYPECLNPIESLNSPLEVLDYHKELEKIKLSIGVSNIIVRPYEKEQYKNNNIFSDFLSILNLELTDEFILPPKKVNPRLNRDFMEIKRVCNSLPIDGNTLYNLFSETLMQISANSKSQLDGYECSLLSYEEKLDILNKYDESNQKIAREYLKRNDGRLFMNLPCKGDKFINEYNGPSKENIIKAFGYLYYKQYKEINTLENFYNAQNLKLLENIEKFEEMSSKINLLLEENKEILEQHNILKNNISLEYFKVINSRSWKLTKPLRSIKNFISKLRTKEN